MISGSVSRRAFLKVGLAAGAGLCGLTYLASRTKRLPLKMLKANNLKKGLVVIHCSDKEDESAIIKESVRKAINALGGMDKLVSKGDRVVIKPNIAWNQKPEFAANTNPCVVAALIELCIESGANRVKVLDHTCSSNPRPSYESSGIADAARKAGAEVLYINKDLFRDLPIPDGKALKSWAFYEDFISADKVDVLINVPVAKHHSTSRLTMALKNVLGMVGMDRGALHKDIHPKIADLNRVVKVDLTVLDAFRILRNHGPTGGRLEDVDNNPEHARRIIVSTDPVAVDAYGATLFGLSPHDIGFIKEAHEAGIGELDFKLRGFEEIRV
ncbi:MAG TPA: DUF362 domain-containing protein [Candidatus Brocadiia bacterium]|nr:DUF362 domain-containing protein [Candidatus Brocadiales bacterium]